MELNYFQNRREKIFNAVVKIPKYEYMDIGRLFNFYYKSSLWDEFKINHSKAKYVIRRNNSSPQSESDYFIATEVLLKYRSRVDKYSSQFKWANPDKGTSSSVLGDLVERIELKNSRNSFLIFNNFRWIYCVALGCTLIINDTNNSKWFHLHHVGVSAWTCSLQNPKSEACRWEMLSHSGEFVN